MYNVVALGLANVNSYLWNTLCTFRDQAQHDAKQVGLFTAQGLLNVGVSNFLLWLTAHGIRAYTELSPLISGNVAKGVSMVVASTMSFLFLRSREAPFFSDLTVPLLSLSSTRNRCGARAPEKLRQSIGTFARAEATRTVPDEADRST